MPKLTKPLGLPKTGGRKKGTPNRFSRTVKELALEYVEESMKRLGKMATSERPKSDSVQLSAIKEVFDRAVGRAEASVSHTGIIGHVNLSKATDDELKTIAGIYQRIAELPEPPGSDDGAGAEGEEQERGDDPA